MYSFWDFAGQFGGFYELLEVAGYMIAGIYNSLAFDVALVNSYISGEDTTGEGKTNRTQRHTSSRRNQINPHTNQNNRAFELVNTTNTLRRQRGLSVNQNKSKSHSF